MKKYGIIRPKTIYQKVNGTKLLKSLHPNAQPSILLFISMGRVSHLTPSLLSGWLLTNVQVTNVTIIHDTHGHIYIHHIGITILLFFLHFFHSLRQVGQLRLFLSDTSWSPTVSTLYRHILVNPYENSVEREKNTPFCTTWLATTSSLYIYI